METLKTLADAAKENTPSATRKGYSGKSIKVGKGNFTPLKTKSRGGLGNSYRRGHNEGHSG